MKFFTVGTSAADAALKFRPPFARLKEITRRMSFEAVAIAIN